MRGVTTPRANPGERSNSSGSARPVCAPVGCHITIRRIKLYRPVARSTDDARIPVVDTTSAGRQVEDRRPSPQRHTRRESGSAGPSASRRQPGHRKHLHVRRSIAVAIAVTFMLVSAAAAHASTVGTLRLVLASRASVANANWTATNSSVVILQAWDTKELYALKAANPAVKVVMYQNASAASSSSSDSSIYPIRGFWYDQAQANGWLLDNTSGSSFTFHGYPWLYAADIGAPGYQDAWASNVIAKLQSAPWDGVFMDDVNPTIKWHYCVTCVSQYPSRCPVRPGHGIAARQRRSEDSCGREAHNREFRLVVDVSVGRQPMGAVSERRYG